jgi:Na+/proline symporter
VTGYSFAQGLLWTTPAVTVGAFLVALLILRSVFRRPDLAKLGFASTLVASMPAAVVIAGCLIASLLGEASVDNLIKSLLRVVPLLLPVSFLTASLIFWRLLASEDPAKRMFASVLTAQLACAVPIVAAAVHALAPTDAPWWAEAAVQAFFVGFTFLPAVLLVSLWLVAIVRQSRSAEQSYKAEARTALGIGIGAMVWAFLVVSASAASRS